MQNAELLENLFLILADEIKNDGADLGADENPLEFLELARA